VAPFGRQDFLRGKTFNLLSSTSALDVSALAVSVSVLSPALSLQGSRAISSRAEESVVAIEGDSDMAFCQCRDCWRGGSLPASLLASSCGFHDVQKSPSALRQTKAGCFLLRSFALYQVTM
jgi:hypothetical protein